MRYQNALVPLGIPEDKIEAMMCKMFDTSLKGPALTWYYGLKPRSIDSFGDLSTKFQGQFTLGMRAKNELSHLFSMVQRRDETLRSYTQRFNKEMIDVTNYHDLVSIQAFRKGLINETLFYDSLTMRTL